MNEEELKQKLGDEAYEVLRKGGTEVPFSGEYYKETAKGSYNCKVCGNPLFSSDAKFHSDIPGLAGWPSFNDAIPGSVEYKEDNSLGRASTDSARHDFAKSRTEVVCAKCKSHLGHLFDDAESKTGKHLCINSVCLDLKKEDAE